MSVTASRELTPVKDTPGSDDDHLLAVSGMSVQVDVPGHGLCTAVDDVSFTLGRGEVLGIVGESGSGKTMTALGLCRLVGAAHVTGTVRFEGRDLVGASPRELRRVRGGQIGVVYQDPMTSLNPVMTVGRQITETLSEHEGLGRSAARHRAAELLDLVGIPAARSHLDDYPHQFSGGMRQRVMIAIAISCSPKLLIADEPTTALDVTIQAQILDLIKDLRERLGMAVLLISHDLGVIAGTADRVNVMYAGRIVESGPVEAIFDRPAHPYTAGLLASISRLDTPRRPRLDAIEGVPPNIRHPRPGCAFWDRCPLRADPRCEHERPPSVQVAPGHWVASFCARKEAVL